MGAREMLASPHPPATPLRVPWWVRLCRWGYRIVAFLGGTVILSLIVNIISTWFTSSKGILPADSPAGQVLDWTYTHWLPSLLIVSCCFLLAVLVWMVSRWSPDHPVVPLSLAPQKRLHMLRKLRRVYLDQLDQSLQKAILIELDLAEVPGAVEKAGGLQQPTPPQAQRLLPTGTSITQVYDEAGQELLMLGAPGAGKSTLLLTLALELLQRAEQESSHPLPVILPLSSWAVGRPPFEIWLCEQLSQRYKVPLWIGTQWVREDQILPLLDGLDELEESARLACITAINAYHREHLMPLVVCSCTSEYELAAEQQRLLLQNAVVVRPLRRVQIDTYLAQAGKPLAALQSAFKRNRALRELATIPLMLNILTLTYWEKPVSGLSKRTSFLLQQIWANYVQRMAGQKGNAHRYPLERIRPWFHWLAQQMRGHHQSTFYLDQLQTDWLPARQSASYQGIIRLIDGVAGFLIGTLVNFVIGGPLNGVVGGLVWMLVFFWYFGRNTKVEPVEIVVWSRVGALYGLVVGLLAGEIFKAVFGLVLHALNPVTFFLIAPVFGFACMLYWGLTGKQLTARDRLTPNESIWRSAKIGLVKGLPLVLVAGLVSAEVIGTAQGVALGLLGLLFFGLNGGLLVVARHFILRVWLWKARVFPWNALNFLEDAKARRILLRQPGGGYSFAHRLLLDYFADLDMGEPLPQVPARLRATFSRTTEVTETVNDRIAAV